MTELSVVVPVYGCGDCLRALHKRLVAAVETVTESYELILVDDRSEDGAWEVLEALVAENPAVTAIRLSRNFGQHAAITAGLAHAGGRWTVVMDCDLQEPPEEIPRLYEKAREGYDVVFTVRSARRDSRFRRLAGSIYFRARSFFVRTRTGTRHGTLSILSRKVVVAFLRLRDRDREYLISVDWLGFRTATIEFEHAERFSGRSSYDWRRLARVAVDGMFFQTTVLLRWIVLLGFAIVLAGLGLAGFYLASYFVSEPPSGYTSIAVLLLVLSGAVISSLGVIGLYVGKTFEQVKERPLYVVDELYGPAELRAGEVEPRVEVGDPQ